MAALTPPGGRTGNDTTRRPTAPPQAANRLQALVLEEKGRRPALRWCPAPAPPRPARAGSLLTRVAPASQAAAAPGQEIVFWVG